MSSEFPRAAALDGDLHYELAQGFYFEAAHTLQREIETESSRRIHGHTYNAEVVLRGSPDPDSGMLMDLALLRTEIARVRKLLDHHMLDDIDELGPATMENLCRYIFRQLESCLPALHAVSVARQASGDRCTVRRSRPSS